MPIHYRQGDVLLIAIDRLPDRAIPEKQEKRVVLAYGEVTGHAHALDTLHSKLYSRGTERFLATTEGAFLVHEEHDAIALPAGFYRVVIQHEYAPNEILPRPVID